MSVIGRGRAAIARRTFLRAGGTAVALPLLEAMRPAIAAPRPTTPKRFVVMFSPNGTIHKNWVPQAGAGGEGDFTLSPILQPLTPHQADLVIVDGLTQHGSGGDGHQNGIGGMLTGQSLNRGPFQGGANAGSSGWAAGISVDQRAALALGGATRFRSLELGVQVGAADNWSRMSYAASNRPLPPEEDPLAGYARLFGGAQTSPDELARLRARRRSVLDAVRGQFSAVQARVGAADRARLEAHAASIREIELRLDLMPAATAACRAVVPPAAPASPTTNDSFPAVGALQMDLLALALTCDLTRVASLQWSRSVSQTRFTWLGIRDGHHELSHLADDDAPAVGKLTQINTWYAQQFAYLVAKLAAAQETDGSRLLDSSLLLWCNDLGKGNTHKGEKAPYVLAGKAGGAVRTGRFLTYPDAPPHNDLLVSLLQALDVPATTFGKAEWCRGPLPGFL